MYVIYNIYYIKIIIKKKIKYKLIIVIVLILNN